MKLLRSTDGRLGAFSAALSGLAADAPRLLGEAVAEGGTTALDREFLDQADPAGNPWAKRKPPTGSWPILRKTRRMYSSRNAAPVPNGADFTVDTPAEFHQGGTVRMVARELLPKGTLPEPWRVAIAEAVRERIADRLRVLA